MARSIGMAMAVVAVLGLSSVASAQYRGVSGSSVWTAASTGFNGHNAGAKAFGNCDTCRGQGGNCCGPNPFDLWSDYCELDRCPQKASCGMGRRCPAPAACGCSECGHGKLLGFLKGNCCNAQLHWPTAGCCETPCAESACNSCGPRCNPFAKLRSGCCGPALLGRLGGIKLLPSPRCDCGLADCGECGAGFYGESAYETQILEEAAPVEVEAPVEGEALELVPQPEAEADRSAGLFGLFSL